MSPAVREHHPALAWKEVAFQRSVIHLATSLGWFVYHTHDSRRSQPGFPDLVLVHSGKGRVLWRELKTETGRTSVAQDEWLMELTAAGEDAQVWRPRHWVDRTIEQELRK